MGIEIFISLHEEPRFVEMRRKMQYYYCAIQDRFSYTILGENTGEITTD